MKTLRLSPDLQLPLEAVTETFALLAARRAGKTNTGRVMAEEMHGADLPFVAIDPVGSWYGLRSSRDGRGPGLPIPIFGGRHGDVPLEQTGGVLIADLIVDENLSCVLDVSQFESEGAKKRFLLDFARRLYQRNETPRHLFLEEADDYCPQHPMRDEAQLVRAWENIVRRGGQRGLGCTMLTQRSAAINKSVLTQTGSLIALRTTGPQDRDAIGLWLKHHAQSNEILASLAGLKNGEAWVWSPHFLRTTIRVQFRLSTTFDSGATPKVGAKRRVTTLADVDLAAVQQKMSATIERAKATDPKVLQARIADLERQIAQAPKAAPAAPAKEKIVRVDVPVLRPRQQARLEKLVAEVARAERGLQDAQNAIGRHGIALAGAAAALRESLQPPAPYLPGPRDLRTLHQEVVGALADAVAGPPREPLLAIGKTGESVVIGGGERKMLEALAMFPDRQLSPARLALLSGYVAGGSTYRKYLSTLRAAGLVERSWLAITPEGLRLTGRVHEANASSLVTFWRAKLGAGEQKIFDRVVGVYPNAVAAAIVAEQTGYELGGSTWRKYVSTLRSLGLLARERGPMLKAASELFGN